MTQEQETTKQMIEYCKNRQKESGIKGGYYQKTIDSLDKWLKFVERVLHPMSGRRYRFVRKVRK
jgi:hypothetical protein